MIKESEIFKELMETDFIVENKTLPNELTLIKELAGRSFKMPLPVRAAIVLTKEQADYINSIKDNEDITNFLQEANLGNNLKLPWTAKTKSGKEVFILHNFAYELYQYVESQDLLESK